ncbi:MAG: HNH endonuclease [Acidimicrobiia bacterium]|nr:HNH endonuclease [Acidimicrobiia bacterium]
MIKPCLDCSMATRNGSICRGCQLERERKRNASRPHLRGGWRQMSQAQRRAQPWCSSCGAREDLTVDHIVPRSLEGGLATLCRSCNGSKGDRR